MGRGIAGLVPETCRQGPGRLNSDLLPSMPMVYTRNMEPNQTTQVPTGEKAKHAPPHIFDLTFKNLFHLSKRAVINLINGCFDRNYPLDSALEYLATENVTDELGHSFCDISIRIANTDDFIFEAQSGNDSSILIRIFEYGYHSGLKRKIVRKGHITEIQLPYAMVIYWVPKHRVPEQETLRLLGPDGRFLDYEIKSFNFLGHSIEELEEKKMSVLLPFYVLKHRDAVKSAATSEDRQVLALEMRGIIEELMATIRRSEEAGLIERGDVWRIFGSLKRLYEDAYKTYREFVEVDTMVEDTFFQEYEEKIREAEERAAKAAEKKAEEWAKKKAEGWAELKPEEWAKKKAEEWAERSREIAQYLIRKNWDIREIAEATKLDMDTVKSLYAQG